MTIQTPVGGHDSGAVCQSSPVEREAATVPPTGPDDYRPGALPPDWSDFGLTDQGTDWQERGVCARKDPGAFFPGKGGSTAAAKRICAGCPVRAECLTYALANLVDWGVWGGLTEAERRPLIAAHHDVTPCARPGCEEPRGLTAGGRRRKYCSDVCMYAVAVASAPARRARARKAA